MEYYLITYINMWFIMIKGFASLIVDDRKIQESGRWIAEQKRKKQSNAKVIVTLQCGSMLEQLSKVSPFRSTKEL